MWPNFHLLFAGFIFVMWEERYNRQWPDLLFFLYLYIDFEEVDYLIYSKDEVVSLSSLLGLRKVLDFQNSIVY